MHVSKGKVQNLIFIVHKLASMVLHLTWAFLNYNLIFPPEVSMSLLHISTKHKNKQMWWYFLKNPY